LVYGRKSGFRQDGQVVHCLTTLGKHSKQQMLCRGHFPMTLAESSVRQIPQLLSFISETGIVEKISKQNGLVDMTYRSKYSKYLLDD
jgi:uncharacterized protein YkvS